jgi:hypothetical protein
MFIFQTATPPCPPLIVKGGGHGGTRMFAPSVAMISSPGQQVPPRVRYGTSCLLFSDAVGSVPCSDE